MKPKGERYTVQPGFSVHTIRGLIRGGGYVWENDFPEGNLQRILDRRGKPKLAKDPEKAAVIEYPEEKQEIPAKKAAAKKKSTKKTAVKKQETKTAASKKGEKPSFAFGRK